MRWDLASVGAATGGVVIGTAEVTSVVTDSRRAGPGALFVALRGGSADGHEFIDVARAAGAVAALVEPGRLPDGMAGVEVADPGAALLALAVQRRAELDIPVIAVTGSSGKTTTKDLIAAALGEGAHAAQDSFNNEVGVPLTVLGCPDGASALVVEVGSRGAGHIAALAPAVRPDVAVITSIGPAHLEMFGDLDGVRRAKWELVEALGPEGVAVLPASEPGLLARRRGAVLTFGEDPGADLAVIGVALDEVGRASFTLRHAGVEVPVRLAVSGRHQPSNAAAAMAAAMAVGVDLPVAARRLEAARVSRWRMQVAERPLAGGGAVVVVNDAYNANPASVEAALATVAQMPGRRVAVLGMMHELGEESPAMHEAVGRRAADLGFVVVVVGEDPGIGRGAGAAVAATADSAATAVAVLDGLLRPGDVVLIKASRATGLESLAERIGGGTAG